MHASTRWLAALGIIGLGLLAAVFLGSPISQCLGPLGVTGIECARATGIFPTVGVGLPVLALSALIAVSIAVPGLLRHIGRAGLAAAFGAGIAAIAYLLARPTTWTDSISTGEVIMVSLPFDAAALVTAAILGSVAALLGGRFLEQARRGRGTG